FDEYGSNSLCLLAARQQRGLELRLLDARGDAAQLLQRLDEQLHDLAPGQTPLLSLSAVAAPCPVGTALSDSSGVWPGARSCNCSSSRCNSCAASPRA
ncbi:hypothetical protein, partial [Pseudomonas aeruginosa]